MHRLRRWAAVLVVVGGLCGLGAACEEGLDRAPSGREREARAQLLQNLIASREQMPDPQALQSQRQDLRGEANPNAPPDQSAFGSSQPAASTLGRVEWVGNDELLVRAPGGVEQDVRIQDDTRFLQGGREVSRRMVEQGAEVRVAYDVVLGEWVAREVELLRKPAPPRAEGAEGDASQPVPK